MVDRRKKSVPYVPILAFLVACLLGGWIIRGIAAPTKVDEPTARGIAKVEIQGLCKEKSWRLSQFSNPEMRHVSIMSAKLVGEGSRELPAWSYDYRLKSNPKRVVTITVKEDGSIFNITYEGY